MQKPVSTASTKLGIQVDTLLCTQLYPKMFHYIATKAYGKLQSSLDVGAAWKWSLDEGQMCFEKISGISLQILLTHSSQCCSKIKFYLQGVTSNFWSKCKLRVAFAKSCFLQRVIACFANEQQMNSRKTEVNCFYY